MLPAGAGRAQPGVYLLVEAAGGDLHGQVAYGGDVDGYLGG